MKKFNLINLIAIMFFLTVCSGLAAETATDVIKAGNKKIADIVKSNNNKAQTIEKIANVLVGITDFNTLANNVTSKFCQSLNQNQCSQFNTVFIDLIKMSTASKLSNYKSEQISYQKEEVKGNKATVKTVLKTKDKQVKVDYQLEKNNNKWRIVNYIVEDINTVDNYKKQFTRLFKKEPFDKIINNLKQKANDYKTGKGK